MPDELIYAWLNSKSGFSIMPYVMHVFEVWAYSSLDHVLKYMYMNCNILFGWYLKNI